MESLAAFSLAANILQFISFTTGIIGKAKVLRSSAERILPETADTASVVARLQELAHNIRSRAANQRPSPSGVRADHAVEDVCTGCIEAAEELATRLSQLSSRESISRAESYRMALKAVWNKSPIDALFQRLELFRGEINSLLLSSIQ